MNILLKIFSLFVSLFCDLKIKHNIKVKIVVNNGYREIYFDHLEGIKFSTIFVCCAISNITKQYNAIVSDIISYDLKIIINDGDFLCFDYLCYMLSTNNCTHVNTSWLIPIRFSVYFDIQSIIIFIKYINSIYRIANIKQKKSQQSA